MSLIFEAQCHHNVLIDYSVLSIEPSVHRCHLGMKAIHLNTFDLHGTRDFVIIFRIFGTITARFAASVLHSYADSSSDRNLKTNLSIVWRFVSDNYAETQ